MEYNPPPEASHVESHKQILTQIDKFDDDIRDLTENAATSYLTTANFLPHRFIFWAVAWASQLFPDEDFGENLHQLLAEHIHKFERVKNSAKKEK